MRTYEARVSRDNKREAYVERRARGKWLVTLVNHGRVRSSKTTNTTSLSAARRLAVDWVRA